MEGLLSTGPTPSSFDVYLYLQLHLHLHQSTDIYLHHNTNIYLHLDQSTDMYLHLHHSIINSCTFTRVLVGPSLRVTTDAGDICLWGDVFSEVNWEICTEVCSV